MFIRFPLRKEKKNEKKRHVITKLTGSLALKAQLAWSRSRRFSLPKYFFFSNYINKIHLLKIVVISPVGIFCLANT